MLKYHYTQGQIDLPLSRACGVRTDDTGRLEQTRLVIRQVRRLNDAQDGATRITKLAECKTLASMQAARGCLFVSKLQENTPEGFIAS